MNDVPLYSDITENELAFINKNKLNNVIIKDEVIRYYPKHEIGSQVIGYVENNLNQSICRLEKVGLSCNMKMI